MATHDNYMSKLKRALKRKGWVFVSLEEADAVKLTVSNVTQDNDVLHDWRTYWGFIGFHREGDTVTFYTL